MAKRKTTKWTCKKCNTTFGGPRSLGIHYQEKPSHGAKASHASTRKRHSGQVGNRSGSHTNNYDQDLSKRLVAEFDKNTTSPAEFHTRLGLNKAFVYKLKERGGAMYFHPATRRRIEAFLNMKPKDIIKPKGLMSLDGAGLPIASKSPAVRRAQFCVGCGERMNSAWTHCGHCGSRRATL